MQRSTQLKIAVIGLATGSCLSLIASIMLVLSIAIQYIIPHSVGSYGAVGVQPIDITFVIFIIVSFIGFLGFIFGMTSTLKALSGSKVTIIGAIFLLIAGFSLFVNYLPNPFGGWFSILNWNFGLPIIILTAFYLATFAQKKEEVKLDKKSTLFLVSGYILILCALETAFFIFMLPSTLYFLALSICTVVIALTAGILMLKSKFQMATTLTVFTLLLGISLSVIFLTMFSQVPPASWLIGLLYESPTILLSAVALALALLGQRTPTNQPTNL